MAGNRFVLLDEHGTPLSEFNSATAALRALSDLVSADPSADGECFLAEFNDLGERVGTFAPAVPSQGWFSPDPPYEGIVYFSAQVVREPAKP